MEKLSSIGERLRQERERLGLSQTEVSDSLAAAGLRGATRQTQSRYEKGERSPDAEYLAHLAELGADVRWVVTGDGAPPKATGPVLSAEEQVLLDYFRAASREVRRAALGALMGAAPAAQRGGVQVVGNGSFAVGRDVNLGPPPDPKRRSR